MSDFFGGLRGGIKMPEVVWNQGPLPSGEGLPAPLHQTADARINYNSSLLGDLTPYAYGKPGYLSSQTAYLNIPHKIQKIVPVLWLPEARPSANEVFDLPHPVDDGDIAFVLRLNRNSVFCTGTKSGDMRRMGLGTAVDPLINLPTLNYILSGLQLGLPTVDGAAGKHDMWLELFHNLEPFRFPGGKHRSFQTNPVTLDDVVQFVRHCVRPFGVARGSEKQGGQDEATLAPATWPVNFVTSLTIDGKESNVVNIWHHLDLSAGDDLVLRLKLLPVKPYTLNHYYKGVKRQTWDQKVHDGKYIWQLAPDIMHLEQEGHASEKASLEHRQMLHSQVNPSLLTRRGHRLGSPQWQELGFWHVGRSQIMTGQYGVEEYWHNDQANMLKTNHLDITLQPMFCAIPGAFQHVPAPPPARVTARLSAPAAPRWRASLGLELLSLPAPRPRPAPPRAEARPEPEPASTREAAAPGAPAEESTGRAPSWLDETLLADLPEAAPEPAAPEPVAATMEAELDVPVPGLAAAAAEARKYQRVPKRRALSGSLVKVDGTSEASQVGLL